jgi:hypothetical protein
MEHRLLLPDGEIRWIRSTARLTRDRYGQPAELVGVSVDVTDRRSAELAELHAREEAAESHQRLELLARLSQLLVAPLDVDVTLRHVADLAVRDFADWCLVDLWERHTVRRVTVTHREPDLADLAAELVASFRPGDAAPQYQTAVTGLVPWTATPAGVEQLVAEGGRAGHGSVLARLDLSSVIVVPLVAKGLGIGTLTLVRGRPRTFLRPGRRVGRELGRRAGSAAEKARLYTRTGPVWPGCCNAACNHRTSPRSPDWSWGLLPAWTEGLDVGGDYYDVFHNGCCWWLVLGDVCGKGPAAAAVGTAVRHILRALLVDDAAPDQVLHRLNAALASGVDEDTFTTTVIARLVPDRDGARLLVATGGHLPPLLRRGDGTVEEIEIRGTLLGCSRRSRWGYQEVRLGPGDTLLL